MNLSIKVKINQNGNKYLAFCSLINDREMVLNYESILIMRALDLSPNQYDKILASRDYDNIDLLSIKNDLKKL